MIRNQGAIFLSIFGIGSKYRNNSFTKNKFRILVTGSISLITIAVCCYTRLLFMNLKGNKFGGISHASTLIKESIFNKIKELKKKFLV